MLKLIVAGGLGTPPATFKENDNCIGVVILKWYLPCVFCVTVTLPDFAT